MATYGYDEWNQNRQQAPGYTPDPTDWGGGYTGIGRQNQHQMNLLGQYGDYAYGQLGNDFRTDFLNNQYLTNMQTRADTYGTDLNTLRDRNFGTGDPSYDFRYNQALAAHNTRNAARGGGLSGSALVGAQRLASNLASQEYAADFARRKNIIDSAYGADMNVLGARARNYQQGVLGDFNMRQSGLNTNLRARGAGINALTRGQMSDHRAFLGRQAARDARYQGYLGMAMLGLTAPLPGGGTLLGRGMGAAGQGLRTLGGYGRGIWNNWGPGNWWGGFHIPGAGTAGRGGFRT